ncbi:pleiotropic drug resistance ABC transporter [Phanerochaete sordida]|uniref:Pleiotropic drug resistance ABC transporter n=1 Tax=Phanerochaete sordida TaxID=48140 RepID=A0A9P3G1I1_9APHY|nr:pleiotropic drug resistance ABC transporter [Phanerochaete sordida]
MPPSGEPSPDDAPGTSTHAQNAPATPTDNMDRASDTPAAAAAATALPDLQKDAPGGTLRKQASTASSRSQYHNRTAVELDHFDPEGMKQLERTLSKVNEGGRRSASSDFTLSGYEIGDKPFDLARFLRGLMKQLDNAKNIKTRELGVLFKDLRVVGTGASVSYQPTMGSLISPQAYAEAFRAARHPAVRDLLAGFEGVVRPGEMLLVLGRPGAGCSTLLKVLANHRTSYHAVEGTVHYDSLSPEDITKHFRGDVQYCPEDDVHFPSLTVEQTLKFAASTRTPHSRLDATSREEFERLTVEVLTTVFGLRHVKDTKVGNEYIRGVSGGQRKRVSLSETLATRSLINCWDNSTRGLDASTALEFIQALRIATDIAHQTTIVSIYQAGESLYELFDKVCVIYEGKMAYFGSAKHARQYFIDLGYEPANRQTTADFLVAVTDPNGRIPRAGVTNQPRTASEFAETFRRSHTYELLKEDMDKYRAECVGNEARRAHFRESVHMEHARHTRMDSPYIISVPMQVRALMRRRVLIWKGDQLTIGMNVGSYITQAILTGTIFYGMDPSTKDFFSRGGVLFFAILFSALATMSEIPALFAQRDIVLRQFKSAMYHPFVESVALTLVDIPVTFFAITFFCVILYFLTDLQRSAGQFFIFFLFVFVMTLAMKAWFRALTSAVKDPAPAQTLAGISILVLTLYTGYTIPQPSMIGALKWISYINPMKYGFEGLIVNEFHTLQASCAALIPSGPGYDGRVAVENQVCSTIGSVAGQATVDGNRYVELSYDYSHSHLWRDFGIIVAFGAAFIAAFWLLTELNTSTSEARTVTFFKPGAKLDAVRDSRAEGADEEKGGASPGSGGEGSPDPATEKARMAVAGAGGAPRMTDVFSWQHLAYTVTMPDKSERRLLDDVSGFVAPGRLTALMGESGAGKTTLLNTLAARQSTGVVRGDRFVNGQALPKDFQAQTGYCQQLDTHLATSTVREALLFSAKLRQPPSVPLKEKEEYVERCLEMCGLEAYADAIVGTLNIEFKKRTTIAVELVAKPKLLLFLDEPTSGLDSQSAWAIVAFLRELADKAGQAILCTIHQPSGELFQVFDRLLLLKKGGKMVYFGDLGHNSTALVDYFERNGARHCEPEENPAEYILQVIGAGATATTDRDWNEVWKASPEAAQLERDIQSIHDEGRKRPAVETTLRSEFATSWPYQVATLVHRDWISHQRDPTFIMAKIMLNVLSGLFIGFTFFHSKDSMQGTQNKLFACFMAIVNSVPLAQQLQVPFIAMRDLYEVRERPSRMYSWTALLTAQILAEVPWNIVACALFYLTWYWTVGFPSDAARAGYVFLALAVAFPLYYQTIGQAIAAMAPTAQIAALLFTFLFSFVLVFNGVMQPFNRLGWWKWMYWLSPFTYLIEGLLGATVGGMEMNCAEKEFVQVVPPAGQSCAAYLGPFIREVGGYLRAPGATDACAYCPFRTTDAFLETTFNIRYAHRWRDLGVVFAFVVFNIGVIFAFTYLFRIRGRRT